MTVGLEDIARLLNEIKIFLVQQKDEVVGEYRGWTYKKVGDTVIYNRTVTLTGSFLAVELPFTEGVQLDRVAFYFNSTNSRTLNTRMFSNVTDLSAYEELDKKSGHATQSRVIVPPFSESWRYLTAVKLQINFSSYTVGDKVSIQVQVRVM